MNGIKSKQIILNKNWKIECTINNIANGGWRLNEVTLILMMNGMNI